MVGKSTLARTFESAARPYVTLDELDTSKDQERGRLTNAYIACILMHMRTTLIVDDELMERARRATGIREKTRLVRAGLEALISREAARRLAALGGTQPRLGTIPRRRARAS